MRELHPDRHQVDDVFDELAADDRPVPADRPWVMANMVTSIDGAYAVDGRSGGLGTPGDKVVFHSLRGLADVIVVGAATARDEHYRRPSPVGDAAGLRAARDQQPAARLVLVSRSGHIPDDQPFLSGDGPRPLLVHPEHSQVEVPEGLESMPCGAEDGVDLVEMMRRLHAMGHRWVLTEGGPGLLGQLHRVDMIDELFLTTSPNLVGGHDVGLLGHGAPAPRSRHLHRLWMDDADTLFATYRR